MESEAEFSRQRFRFFEKANICFIAEAAISLLPGDLAENAMFGQLLNQLIGRRVACARDRPDFFDRYDRTLVKTLQYAMAVSRRSAQMLGDQGPVAFPKLENAPRGFGGLSADLGDAAKEEGQPSFPITGITNGLKMVIIGLSMAFEMI